MRHAIARNPKAGTFHTPDGYKDLGWQLLKESCPEYANCIDLGHNDHKREKHWREYDNSLYMHRCTDVITICDECKLVWHTDMSD